MNEFPEQQKSGPHPVLLIGIVLFVIPFFRFILPFGIPRWIGTIGLITILIGAVLSIFKN